LENAEEVILVTDPTGRITGAIGHSRKPPGTLGIGLVGKGPVSGFRDLMQILKPLNICVISSPVMRVLLVGLMSGEIGLLGQNIACESC